MRSSAKPYAPGLHRTDVPDRFEVIDQEVLDMTRIGRAVARVTIGLMVAAVGVAPVTAGTGAGGGGHGSPGGGSTGGRAHGAGGFSSPGPAIASGRAFDRLGRGHHHHHRFHGEHAYGYYDYDVCAYYYRRAQASGSPFWWRRYEVCTDDY